MAITTFEGLYTQVMRKLGWSSRNTTRVEVAKEAVNKAHEEVCEAYDWRELEAVGTFNTVAEYKTGTVSSSGTTITGSGTTFTSGMAGRKFCAGLGKPFFNIESFTSTTQIDLTDSWPFTALSGSTYSIYEDVYSLASNVSKVFTDRVTLHDDNGRSLHRMTEAASLMTHDLPQASGYPESFWLIENDSNGLMQMQLGLRIPDAVYVVRYKYKKKHVEMVEDSDPALLDESLMGVVVQGAIAQCYEMPEYADTNLSERAIGKYDRMLADKVRRRRSESPTVVIPGSFTSAGYPRYPFQLPVTGDE